MQELKLVNMRRLILWDFDGTLATRRGETGWSLLLTELLDEHEPGRGITADHLRPFLRDGFPWHRPDIAHPELSEPDTWWGHVEDLLVAAYNGVGIESARAGKLARLVRPRYVDTSRGWRLYDDTLPVLERLRAEGWRHAILSNHVPELPSMVAALGLSSLIEVVFTSASTGYEKPNRNAFELALKTCGWPRETWMVGDNPTADVAGAEAAGIPAVLVRSNQHDAFRCARDLNDVVEILSASAVRRTEGARPVQTRQTRHA
jgi:putative hydrolase of the HAD superfamily